MKKFISVLLTVFLTLNIVSGVFAHPNNVSEYIFVVFGDKAATFGSEKPFTIDGYTYVPDYILQSHLKVKVWWEDSKKTLHASHKGITVSAREREKILVMPGEKKKIAFYRTNGVLMVPLEPIAAALGFRVAYLPEGKLLRISEKKYNLKDAEILEKYKKQIEEEKKKFKEKLPSNAVHLTFDDGPDPYRTPVILDILKKHNVKATFFMLAGNMKKYPDIVKRIKKEGHSIGLHGATHVKSLFYANEWSPTREMEEANTVLKSIIGEKTKLVRVPYGSSPNLSWKQYENLANSGFLMWDWNVDSADSLAANVSTQTIYNNSVAGLRGIKNPVMLFHDKSNVRYCLDNLISYLKKNGYTIAPITENIVPYNWKTKR